ncbi:hypothetical protein C414_000210021 [Campylobacter jejuni subsp. jejuni 414]|nr:hypothetical protein C414_000210021 [Campylobacter jejuni subsp. jejuni 414]
MQFIIMKKLKRIIFIFILKIIYSKSILAFISLTKPLEGFV